AIGQVGAIVLGAAIGWRFLPGTVVGAARPLPVTIGRRLALGALAAFVLLLIGLPIVAAALPDHAIALFSSFYRSGALVFGGGHVVLPLLQQAVVPPGWVDNDTFLAGYGAAQAVPGPLFTFAAYLGTAMVPAPNGWLGGVICLVAIYLPSFLLLLGVLPYWDALRRRTDVRAALTGVNAAVVGLLLAALYTPVWTSAIHTAADFALALVAFLLLVLWRVPPWLVVVLGALAAAVLPHVV
ncbi:MAG: chromate transporter, partial [Proteobacteria bacterium]|nr:chromate transporter [Pseudomonadota bacterium]